MTKAELSAHVAVRTCLFKPSAEGTGCVHDAVFPFAVTTIVDSSNSHNQTKRSFPTGSPPKPTCPGPRDEGRQDKQWRNRRTAIRSKTCAVADRIPETVDVNLPGRQTVLLTLLRMPTPELDPMCYHFAYRPQT